MAIAEALGTITAVALVAVAGVTLFGSERAVVEPLQPALHASARSCQACGWIESIRADQYTVRMRDGSSRIFDEMPGVKWRLGERLLFIE
jgi:hypothetical protein